MKKIIVLLILSVSIMGILAGCSKKDNEDDNSNETTPTPVVEANEDNNEEDDNAEDDIDVLTPVENSVVKEEYDYNDYIKLGKYKGIEVKVEQLEVRDEDIDVTIQLDLYDNGITPTDVTDRAVKHGDTVNIDFVGYHNGEPFAGGSSEGYELTIGSKAFIDGFEEQLIGAELNKEIDINVVFPEYYNNTTLAGEPAVFKVKINGIQFYELTEDFIKDTMGFDTEEEYRESIREALTAEYADMNIRKKENDIYSAVINGSEITLPENLLEYYESDLKTLYTNIAASYGADLETFITLSGSTMEAFETDAKAYSKSMVTRELIIKAISSAEGIELTEEEFQAEVTRFAEQYGYESNEEFLEEADVDVLREDMLFYKVIDFLVAESIEI
ncbi:MAG: trigger factor [Anaerolineaceae bacterium]|nr:MAG: trigger factor [Anaerolineaceae bacterium]